MPRRSKYRRKNRRSYKSKFRTMKSSRRYLIGDRF